MKKEFNLSEKFVYFGDLRPSCMRCFEEKDIKEFIKRLKREVNLYEGKLTRGRFYDIINELAGDKLK